MKKTFNGDRREGMAWLNPAPLEFIQGQRPAE
jgi:hypothetical protein